MAASSSSGDDDGAIEGINVTPLVDIMLVLLIIFMVTAKIIVSQALPLDLPKAAKGSEVQMVFAVEITPQKKIVVDGNPVEKPEDVMLKAKAAFAKNPDLRAIIRADSAVPHGDVIRVLDLLKQAGISKIAFGTTQVAPEPGAVPDKK